MFVTRCGAVCAAMLCLSGVAAAPALASAASPSAVSAVDTQLLTAAHQGNLWEIATSQDAQADARSSCVKQVAADFVRDHRALDAGVARTAARPAVPSNPRPLGRGPLKGPGRASEGLSS